MKNNIPVGELFADLQVSYTEVVLLNMLKERGYLNEKNQDRLEANLNIIETIKSIMNDKFEIDTIYDFLENGYPRQVKL